METTSLEIATFLKALEETPARIASAGTGVDDARLHSKTDRAPWSANDILAHLRSCADVWGKTIEEMLSRDDPTLPHISPRGWIRKTNYPDLAFRESLQAFATQRGQLLRLLKGLAFEDWSRSATIKERKHTVFTQARRMALHEAAHCEQLEALVK